MPLFKPKSKKPSDKDMPAPKASSLPIALGVQKQSKMKKAMPSKSEPMPDMEPSGSIADQIRKKKKLADGGMVDAGSDDQSGMDALKKEQYADGGMVDLDEASEEAPNGMDELNIDAAGEEQFDDSQISAQPLSSKGGSMDDEMDRSIVSAIRRKMAAKLGS